MFIHDIIKIKYVNLGYLPNYPYHLISDGEMLDAFYNVSRPQDTFFVNMYPYMPATVWEKEQSEPPVGNKYSILLSTIYTTITAYKDGTIKQLPDWIYSYMLGEVVGPYSDKRDIHDVIYPLGADNPDDDFSADAAIACYNESTSYLNRTQPKSVTDSTRPPTMFGEPHVIKSIRLRQQML